MSYLTGNLSAFNRKERFWLLRNAIGESFETLGEGFRERLSDVLGFRIPSNAWWAMDYHFDWLVAGIYCYAKQIDLQKKINDNPFKAELMQLAHENVDLEEKHASFYRFRKPLLTATQEDIDLIVAFDETIILIEAKADSDWSKEQYVSKLTRMGALYEFISSIDQEQNNTTEPASPHKNTDLRIRFLLVSPTAPKSFDLDEEDEVNKQSIIHWLEWHNGLQHVGYKKDYLVKPFVKLQGFGEQRLARVTRCRDDKCTPDQFGNYWSISVN